jgi:hypothetical protein
MKVMCFPFIGQGGHRLFSELKPGFYHRLSGRTPGKAWMKPAGAHFRPLLFDPGCGRRFRHGAGRGHGLSRSRGRHPRHQQARPGACFDVYLPAIPPEEDNRCCFPHPGELPGGSERIMLVTMKST